VECVVWADVGGLPFLGAASTEAPEGPSASHDQL
jgi:hypothetical protein